MNWVTTTKKILELFEFHPALFPLEFIFIEIFLKVWQRIRLPKVWRRNILLRVEGWYWDIRYWCDFIQTRGSLRDSNSSWQEINFKISFSFLLKNADQIRDAYFIIISYLRICFISQIVTKTSSLLELFYYLYSNDEFISYVIHKGTLFSLNIWELLIFYEIDYTNAEMRNVA